MDYEKKKDKLLKLFMIGFIMFIILYICISNTKEGSTGAKVCAVLLLADMIFTGITLVKYNIYNSKSKNMSTSEYLHDRFANAIPETKEVFHVQGTTLPGTIKCPSCGANHTKIKKISTLNRAVSISMVGVASDKIGKQFECTCCHYKW